MRIEWGVRYGLAGFVKNFYGDRKAAEKYVKHHADLGDVLISRSISEWHEVG